MKKALIILGLILAALMLFYGVVSSLVNNGHDLGQAIIIFIVSAVGGGALVWYVGKDSQQPKD